MKPSDREEVSSDLMVAGWRCDRLVQEAFGQKHLSRVLSSLQEAEDYFLVGGAVRDLVRGVSDLNDLDLMVPNGELLVHKILGSLGPSRRNRHGNWRYMVSPGVHVDVIEPRFFYRRFGDVEAALRFFDTSVNALGVSLRGDKVLNPLGGLGDLIAGEVRLPRRRWNESNDFESVHLCLRLTRLLKRVPLRVLNPDVAFEQLPKFDCVDWEDLERLNRVTKDQALRDFEQVLKAP